MKTSEPNNPAVAAVPQEGGTPLVERLRNAYTMNCGPGGQRALKTDCDEAANRIEHLERFLSAGQQEIIDSEQAWKRRAEKAESALLASEAALRGVEQALCDFYHIVKNTGAADERFKLYVADEFIERHRKAIDAALSQSQAPTGGEG